MSYVYGVSDQTKTGFKATICSQRSENFVLSIADKMIKNL